VVRAGGKLELSFGSLILYTEIMSKSTTPRQRPRGRPATGHDPVVTARLPEDLIKSLDKWAKDENMSRGEAVRWIIAEYFKKRAATGLM
jgi:hypothetical protein